MTFELFFVCVVCSCKQSNCDYFWYDLNQSSRSWCWCGFVMCWRSCWIQRRLWVLWSRVWLIIPSERCFTEGLRNGRSGDAPPAVEIREHAADKLIMKSFICSAGPPTHTTHTHTHTTHTHTHTPHTHTHTHHTHTAETTHCSRCFLTRPRGVVRYDSFHLCFVSVVVLK